jgi:nucleoside-diphosphate-sugar epimerase
LNAPKENRAREIAFEINAHLPEDYQEAVFEEALRTERDALTPKRKILIIGGAGYIGSVLTRHLLERGYSVRCFDLLLYDNQVCVLPFISQPGYEFMRGDLANSSDMEKALDGVSDVVFLAGLVGDPITKKYPDAAGKINDAGYAQAIKQLNGRGLNKVVFISTCSNYGLIEGDQLADENFELSPLSLYAKSKVAVEKTLLSSQGTIDYVPTVLRFATAFGLSSRMRFDLTISEFTRALALGEDLLVYDADTWRPYCHVEDFSEVIRRVLEAPVESIAFEVFNAGGSTNNYTKQMIVDAIIEQLPQAKVRYKEHGSDPRNYRVDFGKIRDRLKFEPRYGVPDGIRELRLAMEQGLFQTIERPKSFYGNYEITY